MGRRPQEMIEILLSGTDEHNIQGLTSTPFS
jgi:hypothetical protein